MFKGKVSIVGGGSWGTALAVLLARGGYEVVVLVRSPDQAREVNEARENSRYLPGVPIPAAVSFTCERDRALAGADLVVFAVPSHAFREVLKGLLPHIPARLPVVNVAKGIEEDTLMRMSEVFASEAGPERMKYYAVLSGPSHAEEVGLDLPAAVVVSSPDIGTAEYVQDVFMGRNFRVYVNPDLTGVELGGALKNIIALGTGIADGLGFGDNTKAALMTRGMAEITRLGLKMGANPLTFGGLAGVGDLIVTCTSVHSRNRRAGMEIGRGKTLAEALAGVNMVVEGVRTTRAARSLARRVGVEMPITEEIYRILFEGASPREAVTKLMSRGRTHEIEEVAMARVTWQKVL